MSVEELRLHAATAAQVLFDLSDEIEKLGTALCLDPNVASSHVQTLQAIDLISQKQRLIARLLQADCPSTAVLSIELEQLAGQWGNSALAN